jgi:sigma-B regulation protein RsbU (phosphoserine phosphatase)
VGIGDRELVARFWTGMSHRALLMFLLAVFFTFAAIGFLVDVANVGRIDPRTLVVLVPFSGLVAVAFALIGMSRRYWLFVPTVALQVLVPQGLERLWPTARAPLATDVLGTRMIVDAMAAIAAVALGYTFFMAFIVREGVRRVRADAEMALAREIHVSLVPPAVLETPWCEMHGRSIPASEVGGDLVDALVVDGRPLGFVADVSGHGVPAGTLMGLLKASLRTRLRAPGDLGSVLADLNDVLAELTRPNTFATAAVLTLESGTRLVYALAGHPPILHWRNEARAVVRLGEGGMALGILPGERYTVTAVEVAPGDVFAVLTDGFTETIDRKDRDLGLGPIEAALAAHAGAPLTEIFDRLLGVARAHGPQQDDRTLLLVRVRPA